MGSREAPASIPERKRNLAGVGGEVRCGDRGRLEITETRISGQKRTRGKHALFQMKKKDIASNNTGFSDPPSEVDIQQETKNCSKKGEMKNLCDDNTRKKN